MFGISSYKELHYWEPLWPNSNPGKHIYYSFEQFELSNSGNAIGF